MGNEGEDAVLFYNIQCQDEKKSSTHPSALRGQRPVRAIYSRLEPNLGGEDSSVLMTYGQYH